MFTKVRKTMIAGIASGLVLISGTPAFAYTVEKGDTLTEIAEEHDVSLHALSEANPQIKDVDLIFIGEEVNTNTDTKVETKPEVKKEVKSEVKPEPTEPAPEANASQSEKALLAKLVEAEAKDETYTGKVAVAEVVLNRVESNNFPDTISNVVYQEGQFSPVSNGAINQPATQASKDAVAEALNGTSLVNGATFFWNPAIASNRWLESKQTVKVIGGHEFKK